MKRPYLKTFLLTALMVFGVSQEGNSLSCPQYLSVEKCPNSKCRDNITPFLRWEPGNNSYFELQIFFAGSRIPGECGDIITINSSFCDKSVTTIPYIVPIDILKSNTKYKWRVRALSKDGKEASRFSEIKSFTISKICTVGSNGNDMDCDGIPDNVEKEVLDTSPDKKTLFVRPKEESGKYWTKFIELFSGDPRPGFAKIPQFENAGIEIVVIGKEKHKYEKFDDPDYNPATPDNNLVRFGLADGKLPCNIMEIERREKINSPYHGHTYLAGIDSAINYIPEGKYSWSWDVRGKIAEGKCESPGYCYGKPIIYTYPIDMYFKEGVYDKIKIGQPTTNNITNCDINIVDPFTDPCKKLSPLNLKDKAEGLFLPITDIPDHKSDDDTVEFAPFGMNGAGKITYFPSMIKKKQSEEFNHYKIFFAHDIIETPKTHSNAMSVEIVPYDNKPLERSTIKRITIDEKNDTVHETVFIDDSDGFVYLKRYTRDDVMRKTIVHEMGHALMRGDDSDHCSNPQCIMYANSIDWEPQEFGGPPCEVDKNGKEIFCEHRKGGLIDIRAFGRVYNTAH